MTLSQLRSIQGAAPSTFRLHVAVSQSEIAVLRRSFLPGESATQAIKRLALAKAQEVR